MSQSVKESVMRRGAPGEPGTFKTCPTAGWVWRSLVALLLFGVSFGYVEAAVVVYLRPLYEPLHQRFHADHRRGDIFPLLTLAELQTAGAEAQRWLWVELGREAATLIMLTAVALAIGRNFRQWFAAFVTAFGVWDIFYYVFLKALLGWPGSLMEWDLLFLLPVPWAGPVLAPVLVALSMILAGTLLLHREAAPRPIRPGLLHWFAIVAGGLTLVTAFCWDYRNLMEGGEPNAFNWPLFAVGEAVGLAGFAHAWRKACKPSPLLIAVAGHGKEPRPREVCSWDNRGRTAPSLDPQQSHQRSSAALDS